MALNINDGETERLAAEVAPLAGESKTGAVGAALRERKQRLELERPGADRARGLSRWLEEEAWPALRSRLCKGSDFSQTDLALA